MRILILLSSLLILAGCATTKHEDICVSVETVADSGSMVPVIMPSSWVALDRCYDFEDLHEGDIVVYHRAEDGKRIIHRLTGTKWSDGSWRAKGDANHSWDLTRVTAENFESLCVAHGRGAELTKKK